MEYFVLAQLEQENPLPGPSGPPVLGNPSTLSPWLVLGSLRLELTLGNGAAMALGIPVDAKHSSL